MSAQVIKDHFNTLSVAYGYTVIPLHDEINQISRFLRNDSNRIKDAIELLEMNAVNYPRSWKVFELLGETHLKAGATDKAIYYYRKGLALEPDSETLKDKLNIVISTKAKQ